MLTPIDTRGSAVVDPHEHVHVRGHFWYLLKFFFSQTFLEHAMADRYDSWDAFLCHGSFETFDGIIPRSMLAVYPEEVVNDKIIPYREFGLTVCHRYHEGRNCNNRTNCSHFHPDFINDHWVVPDFICHKWFQGTCEYPNCCWNQHGRTFDSALRSAFIIQPSSRGRYPPVQFRSEEGGTMRQINRRDAARIIMHTMGDFRRREVRKWRFGTHFTEYHDYEDWDRSIDADRVRSEYSQEVARMNDVPRARSPRTLYTTTLSSTSELATTIGILD